jgi:nuclear pore complex protein Nup205
MNNLCLWNSEQDFMSGKVAFRNIMNIILVGVDSLINERTTQTYGILLEKAVHLSLEIFILVMERDLALADVFRPLYQVLYFAYLSCGVLSGYYFI